MVDCRKIPRPPALPRDDGRARRYLSAAHAVETYIRLRALVEGAQGIDYVALSMPAATAPGAGIEHLTEAIDLDKIFALAAVRAGSKRFVMWRLVRFLNVPVREAGEPSHVRWVVMFVDGLVEEELAKKGKIVRQAVRPAEVPK